MADPTPPPGLPDPTPPAAKRIRSLPDRPGSLRPGATVRSVPTVAGATARPAGTYAVSFGQDRSWSRGLGILWALFVAAMTLEAINAAFYLLSGKISWPPVSQLAVGSGTVVLPMEALRLVVVSTCFVGLWVGWSWLRYVLATVDFFSGLWLLVSMIASSQSAPKFRSLGVTEVPVYSQIEAMPKIVLGLLYLGTAAYVMFSVDLLAFTEHRRAHGRVWSAMLVTVFAYACTALVLGAQPIYNAWLQTRRAGAVSFGEDTLRTMADSWSPTCIDDRIDPGFAGSFTPSGRQSTFANFKDLGRLRDAHTAPPLYITSVRSDPLQNIVPAPSDIATGVAQDGMGFQMRARYSTTGATYEHGRVQFGLDLARELFGTWRIVGLDAREVNIERPRPSAPPPAAPDASPAATPAPSTGG